MIDYRVVHWTKEYDLAPPDSAYIDPKDRERFKYNWTSSDFPKRLGGIERLKQRIAMVLLSTPGSDIFDVTSGGGLYSLIGKSSIYSEEDLSQKITLAVMSTKDQIISEQRLNLALPLEERLVDIQLRPIDTKYGILEPIEINMDELSATVRPVISTAAGQIDYFDLSLNLP